jgi:hypothetical protein
VHVVGSADLRFLQACGSSRVPIKKAADLGKLEVCAASSSLQMFMSPAGAEGSSTVRGKRRDRTQRSLFSALFAVQAATLRGNDFQAWESLKVRVIERADSVHAVCRQSVTPSPVPRRLVKAPSRATLSPRGERAGFSCGKKLQIEDGSATHGVVAQHLQPA